MVAKECHARTALPSKILTQRELRTDRPKLVATAVLAVAV